MTERLNSEGRQISATLRLPETEAQSPHTAIEQIKQLPLYRIIQYYTLVVHMKTCKQSL